MVKNILLTGGFGNVGEQVLMQLCEQGHNVSCFEVRTPYNERKEAGLRGLYKFRTIWGDLRQPAQVAQAMHEVQPDTICHVAAIIAPLSYGSPELSYDVNVNGTAHLIRAAKQLDKECHIIFISSYATYGSRNGAANLPPLRDDTPQNPMDNYGWQKVIGEQMVIQSGLPYTILRLCAVMSIDPNWGTAPEFRPMIFLIPLNQRRQGGDVRDIALGIANAATAVEARNRIFNMAGDDRWRDTAAGYYQRTLTANAIGMLAQEHFRRVNPERHDVWFYEDWIDTSEGQRVLQYQTRTPEQYFNDIRRKGLGRVALQLMSPLIRHSLSRSGSFRHQTHLDERTMWELICAAYGCDPATASAPPSGYSLPDDLL